MPGIARTRGDQLIVERDQPFIGPLLPGQREACRQHVIGAESEVDADQLLHRADHQAGADQQHDCERRFDDDQAAAKMVRAGGKPGGAAAHERLLHVRTGRLERGEGAENDAADCRCREGERHRGAVDPDVGEARRSLGRSGNQRPQECGCQQQAECTAGCGQHRAVDEQLGREAHTATAESGANREVVLSCRAARDEQAGDVRARDQQQAGDRTEQREQRRPYVGHHAGRERLDQDADRRVGRRILPFELSGDPLQLAGGPSTVAPAASRPVA